MWSEFFTGAIRTLELAGTSWLLGLPVGFAIAWGAHYSNGLRQSLQVAALLIAVVPLLAILFWLHYPLQSALGVVWTPLTTTLLLFATYIAIVAGDILASEMKLLEAEYAEVALVIGLSSRQFMLRVLIRGAVERGLPRFLSLAVISVHMTMFASLIGVEELFRVTQRLNAKMLRPIELYTVMAIVYAILCLPLHLIAIALASRFRITHA